MGDRHPPQSTNFSGFPPSVGLGLKSPLPTALPPELQALVDQIAALAQDRQGDEIALLELLRVLEQSHMDIRETWFQAALPTNRQRLYALLREIEVQGGWPHIKRMALRSLLAHLEAEDGEEGIGVGVS